MHARVTPHTRMHTPPMHAGTPSPSPPPPRTMRGTALRTPCSMGYWRKKQEFWCNKQGLDRKPGKRETSCHIRRRDRDNRANQTVAVFVCIKSMYKNIKIRNRDNRLKFGVLMESDCSTQQANIFQTTN